MKPDILDIPFYRAVILIGTLVAANVIFYGSIIGVGWAVLRIVRALGG